jgi:hypothetical protein
MTDRYGAAHGVFIDIVGDRLAHAVADLDSARVMHATPNLGVIPIRPRVCDAAIRAIWLLGRGQRECLCTFVELVE